MFSSEVVFLLQTLKQLKEELGIRRFPNGIHSLETESTLSKPAPVSIEDSAMELGFHLFMVVA